MDQIILDAIKRIRELRDVDILKDIRVDITRDKFIKYGNDYSFHSFDLNNIVIDGKRKPFSILVREMEWMGLKGLRGKTVLDVGAWDGWFSLEAVRRGAYVTAIDYYSWILDFEKMSQLKSPYNQYDCIKEYKNELLPGQAYIKKARELLHIEDKLKLECVLLRDFKSEPFDIVFYLGVLYHTKSPLEELEHLRSLTKEYAIIETLCCPEIDIQFYGNGEINNDLTTLWSFNDKGLTRLLLRAGFSKVVKKAITPPHKYRGCYKPLNRLWVYAYV